jgi:hypothetical protein
MTTSTTVARPVRSRRTAYAANPKRFCTACLVERSIMDQLNDVALKGRCEDCAESNAVALVTNPETVPAQRAAQPTQEHGAGWDEVDQLRRCGTCDTSIEALPADVAYCSGVCRAMAEATAAVNTTAPAAETTAPTTKTAAKEKPLPSDVRTAVEWSIREGMTDHVIRVGLNNAWRLRQGNRFTPEAVAAAARVWFEDYNRETFKRGERNTKVLRTLNAVRRLVEG